jgi:hypothetical protein
MRKDNLLWNKLILITFCLEVRDQDNAVGIATGYGLDGQGVGVRVLVGARFFSSPLHSDQFWGPPNLLSNGYRG